MFPWSKLNTSTSCIVKIISNLDTSIKLINPRKNTDVVGYIRYLNILYIIKQMISTYSDRTM